MNKRESGALELDLHFASVPRDDDAGLILEDEPPTFPLTLAFAGVVLVIVAVLYGSLALVAALHGPLIPVGGDPVVVR